MTFNDVWRLLSPRVTVYANLNLQQMQKKLDHIQQHLQRHTNQHPVITGTEGGTSRPSEITNHFKPLYQM
jgi:hypothetical protein